MKQCHIIWKSVEHDGLEHIYLREQAKLIQVVSSFIGVIDQRGFQLDYVLELDRKYRMRRATLSISGGKSLVLISDSDHWLKGDAPTHALPEFNGCIDIDITATPFTNTLPIRRIDWQVGQSEDLKMLYITVPELTLSVSRQRYTCLEKSAEGGLFKFELIEGAGSTSFEALLPVDADGLVIDYPGLFKRVWASGWEVS